MIKRILKTPQHWLTLELCRNIFNYAKEQNPKFIVELQSFDDRYADRLEGILGSVQSTWDGILFHETILEASASYLFKLIWLHPFSNGNKRIAIMLTHIFLIVHDIDFTLTENEMYALATNIVENNKDRSDAEILEACKKVIQDNTKDLKL